MSSNVRTARRSASPVIPAATGIARSARDTRAVTGLLHGRPTFCLSAISTSCSPCRRRLRRSPSRTKRRSMRSYSALSPRRCASLPPTQDIWVPRSASLRCCTPGARTSITTRISIASCRAADCRQTSPVGAPSDQTSSCLCGSYRDCSGGCYLKGLRQLQFFGDIAGLADPVAFSRTIKAARRIDWVVYAKPPFAGPEQVLAYLGRYPSHCHLQFPTCQDQWPSGHFPLEGLSNGRAPKGDDTRCPRGRPPFLTAYGSGRLSPHSSLRPACQWPSTTEAGSVPKPARRPTAGAAGGRTGRKATTSDASLPLLRRSHDDHRRVDPDPAGLPTSMGRQFMIIPRAPSVERSASVCRAAARLVLWPIAPERGKAQQHQRFGRGKPADRGVRATATTGSYLLSSPVRAPPRLEPAKTPSAASDKST